MINIKLFRYKRFKKMDGVRVKTLGRATLFLFNLVDSLHGRRKKGRGREEIVKEGEREGSACYKSRCFCIPSTVF